jgi:predicted methyltransferase
MALMSPLSFVRKGRKRAGVIVGAPNPQLLVLTGSSQSPAALVATVAQTLIAANLNRNALMMVADSANTTVVYLKLGGTTASATVWDIQIPANGSWDGSMSGALWQGSVSAFSAATAKISVLEA